MSWKKLKLGKKLGDYLSGKNNGLRKKELERQEEIERQKQKETTLDRQAMQMLTKDAERLGLKVN